MDNIEQLNLTQIEKLRDKPVLFTLHNTERTSLVIRKQKDSIIVYVFSYGGKNNDLLDIQRVFPSELLTENDSYDIAFSTLTYFIPVFWAWRLYPIFYHDYLANLPNKANTVPGEEIGKFLHSAVEKYVKE
ncbi:hypothetical protein M0R04_15270 [Candidatus Dojkabacteria bacterium]|jgi:hypothetical protein|nr:hypothetical protein [Candidatus Dojkabacteria bacterium]